MIMGFLTKLKVYSKFIYTGIAAILFGYIRLLKHQKRKARIKARVEAQKAAAVGKKLEKVKKVQKVIEESNQEAKTIEKENIEAKDSGARPTGEFGDPRVRDYQ